MTKVTMTNKIEMVYIYNINNYINIKCQSQHEVKHAP
jgi:hypothetical protein